MFGQLARYVLNGLQGSADAPFPPADYNFLNKVWGYIRVAANWTDINWADGYLSKQGAVGGRPPISDESYAIMNDTWGTIRVAANFGDINWAALGYAFTPELPTPAAQPIPEISQPAPQYLPPTQLVPTPGATGGDSIISDLLSLFGAQQSSPVYSSTTRLAPGSGSPDGSAKPMGPDPVVASQNRTYLIAGGIGLAVLGAAVMSKKKRR
jgi:hypothetical protein